MDLPFQTHLKKLWGYYFSPFDSHFREEAAGDGNPLSNNKLGYRVTSAESRSQQWPMVPFACEVIVSNIHRFLHVIDLHLSFS